MKISTLHQNYPFITIKIMDLRAFRFLLHPRNKGVTSIVEQQNPPFTAQEKAGSPFILQSARQLGARPARVLFSGSQFC
jgi:hypothetical protein